MKQFLLGLSVSVAFIVGCVSSQYVSPPVQAQESPSESPEAGTYKCFSGWLGGKHGQEGGSLTLTLNEWAKRGYTLVELQSWTNPKGQPWSFLACMRQTVRAG